MTHAEAFGQAVGALKAVGIEDPDRDVHRIFGSVFGAMAAQHRSTVETCTADDLKRFQNMIAARAQHQPVAQIIGRRAFWKHEFLVTQDTLDPRPETELLVERGIAHAPQRVLDLGTGTGAILLSILSDCPAARGVGVDASAAAVRVAKKNAQRLDVADRANISISDWFEQVTGQFDLIVCNPPYIPADDLKTLAPDVTKWEPHDALSPGIEGLESYRTIFPDLAKHLAHDGLALFEFGVGQAGQIAALAKANSLAVRDIIRDLSGKDRAIALTLS